MTAGENKFNIAIRRFFSSLQYLLYPFSLLYGLIIWGRNKLYDNGVLSSVEFDIPTIAVGNLSVGGTGKTPHVEYLIRLLKNDFKVATLSRGYNRKTRGYLFADETSTALRIGDEPMQFHIKFPGIAVGVGEERALALPQLLMDAPETQVVILDDAFQHRSVKPGLNILLTDYRHLFTRDHIVPFGRLRESRAGYLRADCILVSKCPLALSPEERRQIMAEIDPQPHQQLFFTTYEYGAPYDIFTGEEAALPPDAALMLVSGIADPAPVEAYLQAHYNLCGKVIFRDHHYYSPGDIKTLKEYFAANHIHYIITTEKDAMRLRLLEEQLQGLPVVVLPVQVKFLFDGAAHFSNYIFNYIEQYQQS